jgi:hypothetical protein
MAPPGRQKQKNASITDFFRRAQPPADHTEVFADQSFDGDTIAVTPRSTGAWGPFGKNITPED